MANLDTLFHCVNKLDFQESPPQPSALVRLRLDICAPPAPRRVQVVGDDGEQGLPDRDSNAALGKGTSDDGVRGPPSQVDRNTTDQGWLSLHQDPIWMSQERVKIPLRGETAMAKTVWVGGSRDRFLS